MSVGRICNREVDLAEPDESVQIAARRMNSRNVGTLMVLDKDSRPIGILTDRDLAIRVVAKGLETLSKEMMDFARVSFEGNVEATNAMLGAKTLNDLVDLQTQYTRKNMDQFLAESTKLTELSVKVANEAFAPIKARVDVAVEKMLKPAAF